MPRIPGAESVPDVGIRRDPGISFPTSLPSGMADFGTAVVELAQKQQSLNDIVANQQATLKAKSRYKQLFDEWSKSEDTTSDEAIKTYTERAKAINDELSGGLSGMSRRALEITKGEMTALQASSVEDALLHSSKQKVAKAKDLYKESTNLIAAETRTNPTSIDLQLEQLRILDAKYAGTFTPDEERDNSTFGQKSVVLGAIDGHLEKGRLADAKKVLNSDLAKKLFTENEYRTAANMVETKGNSLARREVFLLNRQAKDAMTVFDAGGQVNLDPIINRATLISRNPNLAPEVTEVANDIAERLTQAKKDSEYLQTFIQAKPSEWNRMASEKLSVPPKTPEDVASQKRVKKALDFVSKEMKDGNLLSLARLAGKIDDLEPITPDNLTDNALLFRRSFQVEEASNHFGFKIPFLTPSEITVFSNAFNAGDSQQKKFLLQRLQDGVGEYFPDVVRQIASKNPEMAVVAGTAIAEKYSNEAAVKAFNAATLEIEGGEYLKNNPDFLKDKEQVKRDIRTEMGNMFPVTTEGFVDKDGTAEKSIIHAATNIYVSLLRQAGESGDKTNPAFIKNAVNQALGGIFERKGGKFIPPEYDMPQSEFNSMFNSMTEGALKSAGGGTLPIAGMGTTKRQIPVNRIVSDAKLVSISPGKYTIWMPDVSGEYFPLRREDTNDYFVFDWKRYKEAIGLVAEEEAAKKEQSKPSLLLEQ